uniref:Uncharacterized protein n=1 Tax=Branchiostoma floridae TaxID=7739 RepID=C3YLF9_BRAFL|eukprot:XP_002602884.1 hypothetical protein BRAFLDRAFT_130331 [Branchiostoma floridae]
MSIRMPDGTPVVLNSGTESGGDDEMAGRATRAAGRHAPGGGTNSASDRSSRYNRLSELMKGKREAAAAPQAQGPGYNRGTYTSHTATNNSYQPGSFMAGGAQGGYMAGSTGFSSGYRSAPSGGGFGGYTGAAGGRFRAADVFPSVFGGTGAAGGSGSTYPRAGMGGGFGGGHHTGGGLGGGHAGFAPPSAAGFQGGFSGGGGFGLNDFSSTTDGLFDPHRPQNFGPGGIRMGDPLDFDDLDPLTPVTPDIPTPSFTDHLRRQPASFTETTRTSYFDRFKTSESSAPKESVTQNGEDHLFISKAYIELERGGRKNLNPMVIQEPPSEDVLAPAKRKGRDELKQCQTVLISRLTMPPVSRNTRVLGRWRSSPWLDNAGMGVGTAVSGTLGWLWGVVSRTWGPAGPAEPPPPRPIISLPEVEVCRGPRTTNGHKVRELYVHSMSHNTYIRGRRARSPLPTGNGQRSPRRFAPHGWPFRDDSDDEWDGFSGFHHLSLNVSEIIEAHRDRWGVANGSPSGWHSVGSRPRPWWESVGSVGNTGRWPVRPGEGSRPLPDPDRPRPGRPVVEDSGWYPPPLHPLISTTSTLCMILSSHERLHCCYTRYSDRDQEITSN